MAVSQVRFRLPLCGERGGAAGERGREGEREGEREGGGERERGRGERGRETSDRDLRRLERAQNEGSTGLKELLDRQHSKAEQFCLPPSSVQLYLSPPPNASPRSHCVKSRRSTSMLGLSPDHVKVDVSAFTQSVAPPYHSDSVQLCLSTLSEVSPPPPQFRSNTGERKKQSRKTNTRDARAFRSGILQHSTPLSPSSRILDGSLPPAC